MLYCILFRVRVWIRVCVGVIFGVRVMVSARVLGFELENRLFYLYANCY